MATATTLVLSLPAFLLTFGPLLAEAAPAPTTPGCTDELISFSPCLSYVSSPPNNLTDTASPNCCNVFSSAIDDASAVCFCYLLRDPPILGFPLNNTRILSLSWVCPPTPAVSSTSARAPPTLSFLCSASQALPPLNSAATLGITSPPKIGSSGTATTAPPKSCERSPSASRGSGSSAIGTAFWFGAHPPVSGSTQIGNGKTWLPPGILTVLLIWC